MDNIALIQSYLKSKKISVTELVKSMGIGRNTFYYQLKKDAPDADFAEKFKISTGVEIGEIVATNVSTSVESTRNENITKEILPISNNENGGIANINPNDNNGINQRANAVERAFRDSGKRWEYNALPTKPVIEAKPISLHPHNDDDDSGKAKYVFAPDGTMGMRVPIVPVKAQAGYLLGFADPEFYEDFETEIIPVYQEHRGTYLGFEVAGDSGISTDPEQMEENIYPGWKVIGKDLPKAKWPYKLHIHKYDRWVIVHKTEGILVKKIIAHDVAKGIITIHSHNPDYEDKDLHLSDIEQIFNVVQIVPKKRR